MKEFLNTYLVSFYFLGQNKSKGIDDFWSNHKMDIYLLIRRLLYNFTEVDRLN